MSNQNKIKNIIFDLGAVLIDLDASKTTKCFGTKISPLYAEKMNPDFINIAHKFERGELSAAKFRKKVCEIFNIVISSEAFDECWNAMIGTMPTNRINMLLQVRKEYRIFVLSNTNEIHNKYFMEQDFWESKVFEKVYLSNLVGMRKPEPEIFELVLNENNLLPEETVFVDDNAENIEAAKKLGIKALLVDKEVEIILNDYLKNRK
ncbi:MAG: HAD family phosphatase [Bacteroidales bacterium]|nr:HAD family phosphatase [Bacteroidales bacterium]